MPLFEVLREVQLHEVPSHRREQHLAWRPIEVVREAEQWVEVGAAARSIKGDHIHKKRLAPIDIKLPESFPGWRHPLWMPLFTFFQNRCSLTTTIDR